MTRDEFIKSGFDRLGAILLDGFTTKEQDAAMLYRKMNQAVVKLRQDLGFLYDETHANRPAPNGAVPTRKTQ